MVPAFGLAEAGSLQPESDSSFGAGLPEDIPLKPSKRCARDSVVAGYSMVANRMCNLAYRTIPNLPISVDNNNGGSSAKSALAPIRKEE